MRDQTGKRSGATQVPSASDLKRQLSALKHKCFEQVAINSALPPLALRTCIVIGHYLEAGSDGWGWVFQESLAALFGVSRQTINEAINALITYGHLQSKGRGGRGKANRYRLALREDIPSISEAIRRREEPTIKLSEKPDTLDANKLSKNPTVWTILSGLRRLNCREFPTQNPCLTPKG